MKILGMYNNLKGSYNVISRKHIFLLSALKVLRDREVCDFVTARTVFSTKRGGMTFLVAWMGWCS